MSIMKFWAEVYSIKNYELKIKNKMSEINKIITEMSALLAAVVICFQKYF